MRQPSLVLFKFEHHRKVMSIDKGLSTSGRLKETTNTLEVSQLGSFVWVYQRLHQMHVNILAFTSYIGKIVRVHNINMFFNNHDAEVQQGIKITLFF